jgi:hypothetical protein
MNIKNLIFDIKEKFDTNAEIVQILENYQYGEIKKFCLQIGIAYSEVIRSDQMFSMYSHDQNQYKFGKKSSPKWYHIRNATFLKYCNGIFGFVTKSISKEDTVFKILAEAKKKEMKVKVYA